METLQKALRPILLIGNFDGVHMGHKALIQQACQNKPFEKTPIIALSFAPHPRVFFQPFMKHDRLTGRHLKEKLLKKNGIDKVVILPFNKKLAALSPDEFIKNHLIKRFNPELIIVGQDFRFGYQREGSLKTLCEAGKRDGFKVIGVDGIKDQGGKMISSTRIRKALSEGNVALAKNLLGHLWSIEGTVIHGEKRGRVLGYPTANITIDHTIPLKYGIYAVTAQFDEDQKNTNPLKGVASYGRRPTFDNGEALLEVHLFDCDENLYDKSIEVTFHHFIRSEQKFESVEALIAQMDQDSQDALSFLSTTESKELQSWAF